METSSSIEACITRIIVSLPCSTTSSPIPIFHAHRSSNAIEQVSGHTRHQNPLILHRHPKDSRASPERNRIYVATPSRVRPPIALRSHSPIYLQSHRSNRSATSSIYTSLAKRGTGRGDPLLAVDIPLPHNHHSPLYAPGRVQAEKRVRPTTHYNHASSRSLRAKEISSVTRHRG